MPSLRQVVTHRSLYPLWYDSLLESGTHLLRTSADLRDLETQLAPYLQARALVSTPEPLELR